MFNKRKRRRLTRPSSVEELRKKKRERKRENKFSVIRPCDSSQASHEGPAWTTKGPNLNDCRFNFKLNSLFFEQVNLLVLFLLAGDGGDRSGRLK